MPAVEVLQTLEYVGGQLNAAPIIEVENFTNWKKRFMCHIIEGTMRQLMTRKDAKPRSATFKIIPDDMRIRCSHEYLNDLEEEYQAKNLLAKSKRFFKKDEEEVSFDDNEVTEVKALMALTDEERVSVAKEKCPKIDNSDMSITSSNIPKSPEAKDFTLPKHDTGEVPLNESQRNTTDPSVVVSDSSATDYDSANESSVCSTPLPPLKKLDGVEHVSGPKTIKSILKSNFTFKAETLKGIIINEPSSAPSRGKKSSSASKTNSAPAGKLKNVKIEDDPPLAIAMKELNELKLQISKKKIISLRRGIKPRNPQHVTKNYETCSSNVHTTSNHNDIEWFSKRETLQAKKAESFKASKNESSSALRSKTPTKRWVSRQN
ncbi:hypothetical protein Tco_1524043 [Tanacetum coccineum]